MTLGGFSYKRNVYLPDTSPSVQLLDDGRTIKLNHRFSFIDNEGRTWTVERGFEADGASIPPFFWRVIGPPLEGRYRNASIVHDKYCESQARESSRVHWMFYEAMKASKVAIIKATFMYLAVRLYGPQFPRTRYTWIHYLLTLRLVALWRELKTPFSETVAGSKQLVLPEVAPVLPAAEKKALVDAVVAAVEEKKL